MTDSLFKFNIHCIDVHCSLSTSNSNHIPQVLFSENNTPLEAAVSAPAPASCTLAPLECPASNKGGEREREREGATRNSIQGDGFLNIYRICGAKGIYHIERYLMSDLHMFYKGQAIRDARRSF